MRIDAERIENTETCEKYDKHWKQDRDAFERLKGRLYYGNTIQHCGAIQAPVHLLSSALQNERKLAL